MKSLCDAMREKLLDAEREALTQDLELRGHLESCEECLRVAESLFSLDDAFAILSEADEKIDAPDELVERLLASEALAESVPSVTPKRNTLFAFVPGSIPLVKLAVAASLVLGFGFTAFLYLVPPLYRARMSVASLPAQTSEPLDEPHDLAAGAKRDAPITQPRVAPRQTRPSEPGRMSEASPRRADADSFALRDERKRKRELAQDLSDLNQTFDDEELPRAQSETLGGADVSGKASARSYDDYDDGLASARENRAVHDSGYAQNRPAETFEQEAELEGKEQDKLARIIAPEPEPATVGIMDGTLGGLPDAPPPPPPPPPAPTASPVPAPPRQAAAAPAKDGVDLQKAQRRIAADLRVATSGESNEGAVAESIVVEGRAGARSGGFAGDSLSNVGAARERFRQERARTEGLHFLPKSGYWRNTYLPGDPSFRFLEQSLRGWVADESAGRLGNFSLHQSLKRVEQPFDQAERAALSLSLASDRRTADGRTRTLIQVGLQGARRQGRRESMDVVIVLDLRRPLDTQEAARMRGLALAFAEANEPGDRFHLLMVDNEGQSVVDAASFQYGSVRLALDERLAAEANASENTSPSSGRLREAITTSLRTLNDEGRALGTKIVFLVSPSLHNGDARALSSTVHLGALAGSFLSVATVGGDRSESAADGLVLAGQGQRYSVDDASSSRSIVERLLTSASRTVARAVRINVRLRDSVELVGVIGSESLDAEQTERVRQAEQSLDARLARDLGIASDRGEDDDGVQIVIPSFFAGDQHVVLLDVVSEGAGPLAEVTVKYKDLLTQSNQEQRAVVGLGSGAGDEATTGELEWNVTKNLLAHRLSETLRLAAELAVSGDRTGAAGRLAELRTLFVEMASERPISGSDEELLRDAEVLSEYARALRSDLSSLENQYLLASLRYASQLKLASPAVPISSND